MKIIVEIFLIQFQESLKSVDVAPRLRCFPWPGLDLRNNLHYFGDGRKVINVRQMQRAFHDIIQGHALFLWLIFYHNSIGAITIQVGHSNTMIASIC
jgi:hypothetical protein